MLKRFSVEGVRTFRSKTTLDLADTRDYEFNEDCIREGIVHNALIIGRNASGKTNFGKALMDARSNFRTLGIDGEFAPFEDSLYLNADSTDPLASFEYLFQLGDDEVLYGYTKEREFLLRDERLFVNGRLAFAFNNSRGVLEDGDLSLVGAEELNLERMSEFVSFLSYVTNSAPLKRGSVARRLRGEIMGMHMRATPDRIFPSRLRMRWLELLIRTESLDRLEGFLRRFGIDEHLEVVSDPDGTKVVYARRSGRSIPFSEACSSGTRTLLDIFSVFEIDRPMGPSLVYLDEFDAFCHFEVAEELLRYFAEKRGCQTICTTHNTSLIQNKSTRPDCVFKMGPQHPIRSLANSTDREIRKANNVEKLYRSGEFD